MPGNPLKEERRSVSPNNWEIWEPDMKLVKVTKLMGNDVFSEERWNQWTSFAVWLQASFLISLR